MDANMGRQANFSQPVDPRQNQFGDSYQRTWLPGQGGTAEAREGIVRTEHLLKGEGGHDHRIGTATTYYDLDGNPMGGHSSLIGANIHWQDGPIGEGGRNGAMLDEVAVAMHHRLSKLQEKFPCTENEEMLKCLENFLHWDTTRTRDRTKRGVEGTNQD